MGSRGKYEEKISRFTVNVPLAAQCVRAIHFGSTGRYLVAECCDGVRIYDSRGSSKSNASGKKCILMLSGSGTEAGLSGRMISDLLYACGTSNGTILLRNVKKRGKPCELRGHANGVKVEILAIADDGRLAVSCPRGPSFRKASCAVWDLGTRKKLRTFTLNHHIWCAGISRKRAVLFCGGKGIVMKVDLQRGRTLHILAGHALTVHHIQLSASESKLVSTSDDSVIIWDVSGPTAHTPVCLHKLRASSPATFGACVGEESPWVVSANKEGSLQLWDCKSGRLIISVDVPGFCNGCAWCADVSVNGRLVALAQGTSIHVLDFGLLHWEAAIKCRDLVETANYVRQALFFCAT
jgi:WD40 repeat protein